MEGLKGKKVSKGSFTFVALAVAALELDLLKTDEFWIELSVLFVRHFQKSCMLSQLG